MTLHRPTHLPEEWLRRLHARFLDVARRRVADGDLEDVVQEALRIVCEKASAADDGGPPSVAWCFQVLRNTVGNYYKRRRTRGATDPDVAVSELADRAPTPLEALEARQLGALLHEGMRRLAAADDRCRRYLERLAGGMKPRQLAIEETVPEAALYRRVYRCREKLRGILAELGVSA